MSRENPDRREYVMLAHTLDLTKNHVNNWFLSEKLDGMRAFWDGGITRGMLAANIPWANTTKDHIRIKAPISTGLWSRYGNVIYAADFWLDQLPPIPLDGELWIDRGMWQMTSSIVKKIEPDATGWSIVKFAIIDSPPINQLYRDGLVKNPNVELRFSDCINWIGMHGQRLQSVPNGCYFSFGVMLDFLQKQLDGNRVAFPMEQHIIPSTTQKAIDFINQKMEEIDEKKGEGIVLRKPTGLWTPKRSHDLLKYKPFIDDEAILIGYIWGRETDKGSKLMGLMGAAILSWMGKTFELSGFTDVERLMQMKIKVPTTEQNEQNIKQEPFNFPGQEATSDWFNPKFPRGSKISFRYRELSDIGIPKEARFLRKAQ